MKGHKIKPFALLLALLLLLGGCAANNQEESKDAALVEAQTQIAALSEELALLRERETAYHAQISALQESIAALTPSKPVPEEHSESVTFRYRAENGGAVITGYSGNASILTLPATLNGLPVVAIAERAFAQCSLTAITLPDGITTIGWFAFYDSPSLAGITLPDSIESIGYGVFDGCDTLTVHCTAGSYAERYAQSYALPYTTD